MKHHNKKGFFLIETLAAFALLIAIAGIITFYTTTSVSYIQKAKKSLQRVRLAQQALFGAYSDNDTIKVDEEPFFCSTYDLQSRGYTTRFHEGLLVRKVVAKPFNEENANNSSAIRLVTICLRENHL